MRVKDKIALITGGGSGLGEATAKRLAEEGAKVVVTDINGAQVERVASEINASGGNALAITHDVTDEAGWQAVVDSVVTQFGKLDVLVNNAGIVITGNVEEATLEDWQRTLSVNLDAVFLGTRAGVKAMKASGGSIINISSIEGIIGEARTAAYNASKGGVRIFTKSAALHCAQEGYNIRVNSVHPGFILTAMVENALAAMPAEEAAGFEEQVIGNIPVARMGEPLDIANGVLFLASDESKYMTGSELVIDGGYTAK
ncbi:MAG: glucose 1-dehydrogenase [Pseudomonadales bacterium]